MSISLPTNIEFKEQKGNRALVIVEPCYPGYGVTLGNALRRTLLSSIKGGAIDSFKVKGIQHEFSSLPNVKEDLIEIILNLKKVRVKIFSDEPVILNLKAKGDKVFTAGDIEKNSQVEIANPDQPLFTVTDAKAQVEMELTVKNGYGYVTVEEREKERVDIGTIMIDAIYSPLMNVGFEVENVRVGQQTTYERLVLKIETDKTISPKEALARAAKILVDHFSLLISPEVRKEKEVVKETEKEQAQQTLELPAEVTEKPSEKAVAGEPPKRKRGRPRKVVG